MCSAIAHVRYIKILTLLRGFLVIFPYLVLFSLCSSLFWELLDNGVVKILRFCPQSLGVMFEFIYIERGQLFLGALLATVCHWPLFFFFCPQ